MNNKYQFPGCCALPVCFFHNCSCLCPTRPFLESPLSARPTTRTWRKRLGLQLPVEVPNNWRPAACRGRSCPREPRSHASVPASVGCCPAPRLDRRLADWRLDGAPLPFRDLRPARTTARRTAHAHRAEEQRQREESGRPSPLLPPHLHSRAEHTREQEHSPVRCAQTFAPSSVFASRFQPSAPDLEPFFFLFPRNHADLQQSHRVSPRAKRKPQHPKPPSPAAACPRQWHHDGHAWRKPI